MTLIRIEKSNNTTDKMPNAQRAVWRKRGSGSPESLCEFGSFCARPSGSGSPAFAKPLGRWLQCGATVRRGQ